MKIIAKRPFISSRIGIGNVPEGRVLDADDGYAESLIKAGLAEKYSEGPALRDSKKSFFLTPNKESQETGPSSQVAQALQPPIAKKSKSGGRRTKNVAS